MQGIGESGVLLGDFYGEDLRAQSHSRGSWVILEKMVEDDPVMKFFPKVYVMEIGIIEFSPVAQFAIARNHKIVKWNRACELLTGRPAGQMVGTDRQWVPFYAKKRPLLADSVVEHDRRGMIHFYGKENVARSRVTPHAWETEAYFENVGGQSKLLRALEEGGYMPVGGTRARHSDFCIVAATNRGIKEHVQKGLRRDDFFYRIHVIPIHILPP